VRNGAKCFAHCFAHLTKTPKYMATTKLYLDTRRNQNGDGIIKILIIHERVQRMYTTGIKISSENYKKFESSINADGLSGKVKNQEFKELYKILYDGYKSQDTFIEGYHKKSNRIIEELGEGFTFEKFKVRFENDETVEKKAINGNGVFALFSQYVENLYKQERIGSALAYNTTKNSIIRFLEEMPKENRLKLDLPPFKVEKDLAFKDITIDFLNQYEDWMLKYGKKSQKNSEIKKGASITTVGINIRQLRTIFNLAIEKGITVNYPFGKRKYEIPASKNIKKSISKPEIQKILSYIPDNQTMEVRSHSFWIFSYLSNGMNFNDILTLKWENYDRNSQTITFVREKTRRTTKTNQKSIKVYLQKEQLETIEKWKSKSGPFIFEFITSDMDAKRKKDVITQFIKVTNKHMNRIGEKIGITAKLDTYTARHSFATILLRSEAPISFISQSLGHSNLQTTESYLGSFEEDKVKDYLNALR
jgi:integrase